MKKEISRTILLRIITSCVALTMITIIAVFGIYFWLEKVTPDGMAVSDGERLTYSCGVVTEGKYTLKKATVNIICLDAEGNEITRIQEIVKGEDRVQGSVTLPQNFDRATFEITGFSLNNIFEIIVMCLCGAVLTTAVTCFAGTFGRKNEARDEIMAIVAESEKTEKE